MARVPFRPFLQGRKWRVDLGFGVIDLPGVPTTPDAEDLAYRAALAIVAMARPHEAKGAQLPLVSPASEVTIRGAAGAFAAQTQAAHTKGGQQWRDQYLRAVVSELGGERLSAFAPPAGNVRLVEYHRRLTEKNLHPRTIRNRLSILGQVLRHAATHGELSALPVFPRVRIPRIETAYPLISERDLRRVRASLSCPQRRTYLSVGFYLGLHATDIERFSIADLVGFPPSAWIRRNTKSSRFIPRAQLDLPAACADDLVDAIRILGTAPERGLTGGRWAKLTPTLTPICKAIGCVVPVGRVLRRSCVWELASRGWSERECAEYLGHVDQRMVREIYVRFPVADRPPGRVRWAISAPDHTPQRLLTGLS